MVKMQIINFLIRNAPRIFNYLKNTKEFQSMKENIKNNMKNSEEGQETKGNKDNSNKEGSQRNTGSFSKFSFQNLISSPMTKDEALKILELQKMENITPEDIIFHADKLIKMNDPEKGGSFYIQNKVFYAKEFLLNEYDKFDNNSNSTNNLNTEKNEKI